MEMDYITLITIFFILISLQPVLTRKVLESARNRLILKIENLRKSRVLLIIHRQERMSLLGFPLIRYISMEDSEEVLRFLEMTPEDKDIDLVLHTPGGLVLAALQIARAINNRKGKVRVIVPHYAMSGGTLIALAASEIIMSCNAVLGPIDPQLNEYPAASLLKIMQQKKIDEIDDKTLILIDIAQKAIQQMQECIEELLLKNYTPEKAKELAILLTEGRWTHDFPITFQHAKSLGINVSCEIPDEFLQLMSLYSQPVRSQDNVKYIERPEWEHKKLPEWK